jgi:hypothetical protein
MFTTIVSDCTDSEIIVYSKQDDPELEPQIGDDIPIIIPQSFGAFQGITQVKSITESKHILITLELCGTLQEKEDRKFYRLPISLGLDYSPRSTNPHRFTHSRTIDISEGGLRFYVVQPFPIGYEISTSFNIECNNTAAHLLLPTKVMHIQSTSESCTVGAKFTEITVSNQEFIGNFIATKYEEQESAAAYKRNPSTQALLTHTKIEYEDAIRIFLQWCRQRQLRPNWVILHDIQLFRDWLALNGYSKREIDQWINHIIQYL